MASPLIATLPMYDWPERRAISDARWAQLRDALQAERFDAPRELERQAEPRQLWTMPCLLLGETCTWPLATYLAGKVGYVATPVHNVPGCGRGTYRSAIVRRGSGDADVPQHCGAALDRDATAGQMAANAEDSLSGWVAPMRDIEAAGLKALRQRPLWTGSHRASIRAVAAGDADFAAIDCVTWAIALEHEPAAENLHVAGWTASRPALPLITSIAFGQSDLGRIRRAVLSAIDAVVLADPLAI